METEKLDVLSIKFWEHNPHPQKKNKKKTWTQPEPGRMTLLQEIKMGIILFKPVQCCFEMKKKSSNQLQKQSINEIIEIQRSRFDYSSDRIQLTTTKDLSFQICDWIVSHYEAIIQCNHFTTPRWRNTHKINSLYFLYLQGCLIFSKSQVTKHFDFVRDLMLLFLIDPNLLIISSSSRCGDLLWDTSPQLHELMDVS